VASTVHGDWRLQAGWWVASVAVVSYRLPCRRRREI
jgi:hypothetical protein